MKPSERLSIEGVYEKLDKLASSIGVSIPSMEVQSVTSLKAMNSISPVQNEHHKFRPEPIYIASPNNVAGNFTDIQQVNSATKVY